MTQERRSPLYEDDFWQMLASANRNLSTLCRQLERLPKEGLRQYHAHCEQAKQQIDPYFHDELWSYIDEELSEDGADDFSAWVVMRGRAFFEEVKENPAAMSQYIRLFLSSEETKSHDTSQWDEEIDQEEYRGYARADWIAIPIYRARFGEELEQ